MFTSDTTRTLATIVATILTSVTCLAAAVGPAATHDRTAAIATTRPIA